MKKVIYNNHICGLFLLTDIFDLEKGKGFKSEEGKYPQITCAASNNGHGGVSNNWNYENCFTIATDGAPGYCFWHSYKFDAMCNVVIAKSKIEIPNNYCAIYISAIITGYLKPRFSYGRKAGMNRLKKQYIPLPIKDDGSIDFEYMESVVKPLIKTKITNLINRFK